VNTFQTQGSRRFRRRPRAPALATTLGLVAVIFGSTAAAQASPTRWAWTETKARQMVTLKATVQVPAPLRASLASELKAALRLYSGLQLAAIEVGDTKALATFQSVGARYRRALETVRNGLQIDAAACTGLGVPVRANRFRRFRCVVTSAPLEIPSVELDYGDRELPLVIEGPPRVEGPFQALLDVRIVGKSAIAYRKIG
jgi:hypothetical protein